MNERTNDHETNDEKIRYAVVGLGWFAQIAVLPAFANASRNSELVGLVSGDDEKLDELGERYGVAANNRVGYDGYQELLESGEVDAVYVAVPNHLHRELAVTAAESGVDVLCEKPLAVTERECEEIIAAAEDHGVKLMTAYRLHFEEANMKAVEILRSGRIGEPRVYSAFFSNHVTNDDDIRLNPTEMGGGALYDIGTYCINGARYVFGAEPTRVTALSVSGGHPRYRDCDCDEATGAVLEFPGDRLATFLCTFGAQDRDVYRVAGPKGELVVEPAFEFASTLGHRLYVDGETYEESFPKRDQVAPEILHFSDCILDDSDPEPGGREGLADVRVIRAIHRSAREGRAISLEPFEVKRRPSLEQTERRPLFDEPELVNTSSPSD
jgi:predicted dehydrogenase